MEQYNGWDELISKETEKEYYVKMTQFLEAQAQHLIFPPKEQRFNALLACRPEEVKVVIIGQDPYHDIGQANGLAFSVNIPKLPPSLKNIYNELVDDLGAPYPTTGNLTPWAKQGVLLINNSLTVEAHKAGSHSKIGWQHFTDAIIKHLNTHYQHIVYIIWGAHAYKKCSIIDLENNHAIVSSHPSPLSCHKAFGAFPPFKGSKPFSQTNAYLRSVGKTEIDFRLQNNSPTLEF